MLERTREWLEPDGLGGFASGTVSGIRTRRYHALLLPATTPPTGRVVLVNGFDAWIEAAHGRFPLSSQRYGGDTIDGDGEHRIVSFETEPWPRWRFEVPGPLKIEHEVFARHGSGEVSLSWGDAGGARGARLVVRPFLSGRDYHSLHHENGQCNFDARVEGDRVTWRPYDREIVAASNGAYRHDPHWYRGFAYDEESARGLDAREDLFSPGTFTWTLGEGRAHLVLGARGTPFAELRSAELARRGAFRTPLDRAADAYIVRRGDGETVVAGYPWFTDWGRDTFLALRGLCLATGRRETARRILLEWAGAVSEGMLPNRFPDRGDLPEYNSVDASLWFVIAAQEFLDSEPALREAVERILDGYARGTRHGIRMDGDGLLRCGEPGVQLTWMDAKVGERVITPREGKPVEIEALWLNALAVAGGRWREPFQRGRAAFEERFWNGRYLRDVVDPDDESFRPNQILAVGGLPFALLGGERARAVVDAVEERLVTPVGLRSLSPDDARYVGRYEGGVPERDGAYHQGTVWPWLLGPFVEAWVSVRGGGERVKREARRRYLAPLLAHLREAGLGHVSEIADGDPPHTPRGCPFQAWSLAELLRLDRVVLAPGGAARPRNGRVTKASKSAKCPTP